MNGRIFPRIDISRPKIQILILDDERFNHEENTLRVFNVSLSGLRVDCREVLTLQPTLNILIKVGERKYLLNGTKVWESFNEQTSRFSTGIKLKFNDYNLFNDWLKFIIAVERKIRSALKKDS